MHLFHSPRRHSLAVAAGILLFWVVSAEAWGPLSYAQFRARFAKESVFRLSEKVNEEAFGGSLEIIVSEQPSLVMPMKYQFCYLENGETILTADWHSSETTGFNDSLYNLRSHNHRRAAKFLAELLNAKRSWKALTFPQVTATNEAILFKVLSEGVIHDLGFTTEDRILAQLPIDLRRDSFQESEIPLALPSPRILDAGAWEKTPAFTIEIHPAGNVILMKHDMPYRTEADGRKYLRFQPYSGTSVIFSRVDEGYDLDFFHHHFFEVYRRDPAWQTWVRLVGTALSPNRTPLKVRFSSVEPSPEVASSPHVLNCDRVVAFTGGEVGLLQ